MSNNLIITWSHFRLQFYYGTSPGTTSSKFGYTDSGYKVQVMVVNNEYINDVSLDFTLGKPFLTKMMVTTNLRTLGPYGGAGGRTYNVKASKLLYVDGRSGPLVNQVTLYFEKCV